MDSLGYEERRLVPEWSYKFIALSFAISWIGAYTSTQIVIHGKYAQTQTARWLWTFLASVAFGFTAIWSMHFVGILAYGLDVRITFDLPLTALSAVVTISFTFAAFLSGYASTVIENSWPVQLLSKWACKIWETVRGFLYAPAGPDPETGYRPLPSRSNASDERRDSVTDSLDEEDDITDSDIEEEVRPEGAMKGLPRRSPNYSRSSTDSTLASTDPTLVPAVCSTLRADTHHLPYPDAGESFSDDIQLSQDLGKASTFGHRFSRETKMKIKAQARGKIALKPGWKKWLKAHYNSISITVGLRAAVWALALISMHYCGMWAMNIPHGRISWNWFIVFLSYIIAFNVCFVGCISMEHMELHLVRQVLFSTITAIGCCSIHYTGMKAVTIYTKAPPSVDAGYPAYLPYTILGMAVFVCVVSNTVLAHNAIISRNRMAEMIVTKRRFWRIMAEKEAAEQANELKQQFISVASHEIRTPLHAVNGYCELLSMTALTEEQVMYVNTIQQACHAINVIAGNVLDFSKLDRNNIESSARPTLVDLRKMVQDQARIIETKGASFVDNNCPIVDVIVSVADNVPSAMYLDETYTYRILMNLLSNAQKFCEEGYIYASVVMESDSQMIIKVSDTGCGIPKSFRKVLFQPFRQADSSMTRPKQGTGLGLSIVKHLAQRMSGTIDVESVEGEGTTFTVRLPISTPTNLQPIHISPLEKKRIKVVYRNERTAELLVDLWNQRGMVTTIAQIDTSLSDLLDSVDAIWTDVESISRSDALQALLDDSLSPSFPHIPVFIVHSDGPALSRLDNLITGARRAVLVKRPVLVHDLVNIMAEPEAHMGAYVRVASQRSAFTAPSKRGLINETTNRMPDSLTEGRAILKQGVSPSQSPFGTPHTLESQTESNYNDQEDVEVKEKILMVEDNMVNQHLGKTLLEKLGYSVVTVGNGMEAIEAVRNTSFFCCFMDCQMPVLDGFAATAKIRELENIGVVQGRLPIIALTANVSTESEDKCRAAGMDLFLPKPFKFSDLKSILAQLTNLSYQ